MRIEIEVELSVESKAKFTPKEKLHLTKDLIHEIKTRIELLMSDIAIPDHPKLLEDCKFDLFVNRANNL